MGDYWAGEELFSDYSPKLLIFKIRWPDGPSDCYTFTAVFVHYYRGYRLEENYSWPCLIRLESSSDWAYPYES